MTGLKTVLYTFWSQFGVPAYLSDCVPDDAVLPYITYEVTQPGFNGEAVLTAFNWHPRGADGNVARSALMDDIATAIPIGGLLLAVDDGYIILYRNDAGFQQDWQDDVDGDIIAGRTSYTLQNYTI